MVRFFQTRRTIAQYFLIPIVARLTYNRHTMKVDSIRKTLAENPPVPGRRPLFVGQKLRDLIEDVTTGRMTYAAAGEKHGCSKHTVEKAIQRVRRMSESELAVALKDVA